MSYAVKEMFLTLQGEGVNAGARAVFVPTLYVEPFGTVAINAALCGTPTITTDFGAFTETVLHGVTGYRCRTFEQFVWAARNTHLIEPSDCRKWAEKNYSLERVGQLYDEYFLALNDLRTPDGWYQMPEMYCLAGISIRVNPVPLYLSSNSSPPM